MCGKQKKKGLKVDKNDDESTTESNFCGYCNRSLKDDNTNLHKICMICHEDRLLHPKCAAELHFGDDTKTITQKILKQSTENLLCSFCRQPCFYCTSNNTSIIHQRGGNRIAVCQTSKQEDKGKGYGKYLLYHVLKNARYQGMRINAVCNPGNFISRVLSVKEKEKLNAIEDVNRKRKETVKLQKKHHCVNFFKKFGMGTYESRQYIYRYVPPNADVVYGTCADILNALRVNDKKITAVNDSKNQKCIVGLSNHFRKKLRFNPGTNYCQTYSHPYGWVNMSFDDVNTHFRRFIPEIKKLKGASVKNNEGGF